jgi:hypothetical protein
VQVPGNTLVVAMHMVATRMTDLTKDVSSLASDLVSVFTSLRFQRE